MRNHGKDAVGVTGVLVNGAYRDQPISGQQRYATEITARLPFPMLSPPSFLRGRRLLTWLWCQSLAARHTKDILVTFTSRGPILRKRHIVVVHDLFVLTNPEWFSRTYAITHGWALRCQIRSAMAVVAVSPITARQVSQRWPNKPVIVASNGVSEVFSEQPTSPRSSMAEQYILAVGSVDPRKNFARLVEAYELLPEELRTQFALRIVGASAPSFAAVEPHESRYRVSIRPTDTELADLYRQASLVVVPSIAEGFGLPLVEALASGGTVICSDIEVFRWIGQEHVSYFNATDPVQMSQLIESCLQGRTVASSAQAKDSVSKRFNWAASAEKLHGLILGLK